jgi:hypothetical protein
VLCPWRICLVRPNGPPGYCGRSELLFLFCLRYFEIKIGMMNILGSLLIKHEENLPYDAMQLECKTIMRKTSFIKIRGQKHKVRKK